MASEPRQPTPADHLHRLVELVEVLISLARARTDPRTARDVRAGYLTRKEIADRLGVSTRWIERHVVPTAQPRSRGRAFYAIDDVERQLASMRGRTNLGGRAQVARQGLSQEARRVEEDLERALSARPRRR